MWAKPAQDPGRAMSGEQQALGLADGETTGRPAGGLGMGRRLGVRVQAGLAPSHSP